MDFEVAEKGRYRINAFITHSEFGARYQAFLDGEELGGELDLCATGSDPVWVSFDTHDLAKGKHTLRFEGRGPSANHRTKAPGPFALDIGSLVFLRLEDMAGYREAMKATLEAKSKK